MKKTSHSLDAEAATAIEELSKALDVSRAEVVRRCTVAMIRAHKNGQLPRVVENGYDQSPDQRRKRGAVGKDGSLGRAPSLGSLSNGSSDEDANVGMEQSTESSSEGDQRGSDDQDGADSFHDKRLF